MRKKQMDEPKHVYTCETIVERLTELRDILVDDQTVVSGLPTGLRQTTVTHLQSILKNVAAP